jgi:hypothetical protein
MAGFMCRAELLATWQAGEKGGEKGEREREKHPSNLLLPQLGLRL